MVFLVLRPAEGRVTAAGTFVVAGTPDIEDTLLCWSLRHEPTTGTEAGPPARESADGRDHLPRRVNSCPEMASPVTKRDRGKGRRRAGSRRYDRRPDRRM